MKRFISPIGFIMVAVLFSQTVLAWDMKFLIEPQFESMGFFDESDFLKVKKDGKYGIVDFDGKIVAQPVFDLISDFIDGVAIVKQDEKYGFVSDKGQYLSRTKFDNVMYDLRGYTAEEKLNDEYYGFSDGLLTVKVDGKWGYANKNGEIVIEAIYKEAYEFEDGMAYVKLDGKQGIIDLSGKYIIEPRYPKIKVIWDEDFESVKLFAIYDGEKWGLVNKQGEMIFEPRFIRVANEFVDGKCYFSDEQGYGFVNEDGEIILSTKNYFSEYESFSEGLLPVSVGDYWGYMDTNSEMVIEPSYEYVDMFSEGLAVVGLEDQYGFINKNGEMIIQPQFDDAEGFHDGKAIVEVEYQVGMIDINGDFIVEPQYDYIYVGDDGLYYTELDSLYGLIDENGNTIAEPIYDYIHYIDFSEGNYFIIERNGQYGVMDREGNIIIALQDGEVFELLDDGIFVIKNEEDLLYLFDSKNGNTSKALYDYVNRYDDEYYYAFTDDGIVFLDKEFHEVLHPGGYDMFGMYKIDEDLEPYSLEKENSGVITNDIEDAFYVSPTTQAVQVDGLWGIVDMSGQE